MSVINQSGAGGGRGGGAADALGEKDDYDDLGSSHLYDPLFTSSDVYVAPGYQQLGLPDPMTDSLAALSATATAAVSAAPTLFDVPSFALPTDCQQQYSAVKDATETSVDQVRRECPDSLSWLRCPGIAD